MEEFTEKSQLSPWRVSWCFLVSLSLCTSVSCRLHTLWTLLISGWCSPWSWYITAIYLFPALEIINISKEPLPSWWARTKDGTAFTKMFYLKTAAACRQGSFFSQKCSLMWLCIHCCQIPSLSWTKILAFCWKYDVHFNCILSTLKLPLAKTHTLLRLLNPFLIPMDPSLLQVRFCTNTWVRQWLY